MKKLITIFICLLFIVSAFTQKPIVDTYAFGDDVKDYQFSISGTLYDQETNEIIIFGNVALYSKDGTLLTGVEADIDGNYHLENISPGYYQLESSFIGYETKRSPVFHLDSHSQKRDIYLKEGGWICCSCCIIIPFEKKLIDIWETGYTTTFTANDIAPQYKNQNNDWGALFTIREKTKKKKKKKRKSKTEAPVEIGDVAKPAIKEEKVSDVKTKSEAFLYPNPSSGIVNIVSESAINNIIVTNIQGKLVSQSSSINGAHRTKIDLSALPTGNYFIQLESELGTEIKQIILTKD